MPKATSAVFFCLLAASLSVAGYWEFEQVDTGGMGAGLHMRRGLDGRLYLAYLSGNPCRFRLATYDTVWHFEDPGIPQVYPGGFSFDVGPHGEIGVAYEVSSSGPLTYAWRTGLDWRYETIGTAGYRPCLSFDTSAVPSIMYGQWSLVHAERPESTWLVTTVRQGGGQMNYIFSCWRLATDRANRLHAFCDHKWSWPSLESTDVHGTYIDTYVREETTWTGTTVAGGVGAAFSAMSMALRSDGNEAVCYHQDSPDPGFYYGGTRIDGGSSSARVAIDSLDRPHIAHVFRSFIYRYLDGRGWHISTILPDTGIVLGDIAFDSAGQPIVAYHVPGNGVWLAHGVDVVGVEEAMNDERGAMNVGPSIVRGRLWLAPGSSASSSPSCLLDAAGRRVMELQPGANDVSRLAPGIYFVRSEPSAAGRRPSAIRRVIVTR